MKLPIFPLVFCLVVIICLSGLSGNEYENNNSDNAYENDRDNSEYDNEQGDTEEQKNKDDRAPEQDQTFSAEPLQGRGCFRMSCSYMRHGPPKRRPPYHIRKSNRFSACDNFGGGCWGNHGKK